MTETSKALQDLFYKYTHLPIGGKEIVCPHWMNKLKTGIFGPFGGKGTPEQIVEATTVAAREAGVDLGRMSEEQVVDFMKRKRIGVDCSGFVFWMLDTLDREKGGNGIADDIPGCQGRVLKCRANVLMLTEGRISLSVKLAGIKVGDMIRLCSGKHIAIVFSIEKDKDKIVGLEYAHSSDLTKTDGVHLGKIRVTDQLKSLAGQEWFEKNDQGENYGLASCHEDAGDGIRRLFFFFDYHYLEGV